METYTYHWSTDDIPCDVVELHTKYEYDKYPIVVTPIPAGMKHPKFNWSPSKMCWVETDPEAQGAKIVALEKSAKQAQTILDSIQKNQTEAKQSTERSDEKLKQVTKLIPVLTTNQGQMMSMLMEIKNDIAKTSSTDVKKESETNA